MSKIDTQTETKIVALIARGDSYSQIKASLEKEGVSISTTAIGDIKARNEQALSYIQNKLIDHETTKTARILNKTRDMIEKKLDAASGDVPVLQELIELRDNGEIDDNEFARLSMRAVESHSISIKDLTTVSKEMFNQSQIEAGKPTSISETPEQAKKNLQTLLEAINNKDEAAMVKAIFLDA
jgi:hypothetical protein